MKHRKLEAATPPPVKTDVPRALYRQKVSPRPEMARGVTVQRVGWWRAIRAILTGRKP